MNSCPSNGNVGQGAADQIRAIARLRKMRQDYGSDIPRAALADSLALGYFRSPLQGFHFAASPEIGSRLNRWRAAGYRLEVIFLKLDSPQLALRRIAARVKQGGHDVPRSDVLRRFERGWQNFLKIYRLQADVWSVYDNSGGSPVLIQRAT